MINPGSDEAIKQGCTCPVMDNGYGKGAWLFKDQKEPMFWNRADCPLHGSKNEDNHDD